MAYRYCGSALSLPLSRLLLSLVALDSLSLRASATAIGAL